MILPVFGVALEIPSTGGGWQLDAKEWLILIGMIGQMIYFTARSGWQARGFREDMHKDLTSYRDECMRLVGQYRDETRSLIDNERTNFGETIAALRQYIANVEKQGFVEYMRRDSFHSRMNDLQGSVSKSDALVQSQISEVKAKIGTLETKIDAMRDRLPPIRS